MQRCINCYSRVQYSKKQAVNKLTEQEKNILSVWLSLQEFPDDASVCYACSLKISESCNEEDPPRKLGHTYVCIGCGRKVTKVKKHKLMKDSPLLKVFPTNINVLGYIHRVCHPCWLRGKRCLATNAKKLSMGMLLDKKPAEFPILQPYEDDSNVISNLILPNYKRATNTAAQCIYSLCQNKVGQSVPTFIKIMLIKEHNFYVPPAARVCKMHLVSNTWQSLPDLCSSVSVFNVKQIEDLIDLAKQEISFTPITY